MKSYRLVRVLIHPGQGQAYVVVVAREAGTRGNLDRILLRSTVAPVDASSAESLLRAAAAELLRAADRL